MAKVNKDSVKWGHLIGQDVKRLGFSFPFFIKVIRRHPAPLYGKSFARDHIKRENKIKDFIRTNQRTFIIHVAVDIKNKIYKIFREEIKESLL